MSAATDTRPAAYEAWGRTGGRSELLGVGATKGDCDRIHRGHEGGGITVRGGVVLAVKTGTAKGAVAELRRASEAAWRERGDLPAPAETDRDRERAERAEAERERQRAALRLVAPLPEEPVAVEGDDESDDEEPAEPSAQALDDESDEDTDDTTTAEDTVDRTAPTPVTYTETANATPVAELAAAAATEDGDFGCTALGCTTPRDALRSTTRPEVADLCSEHRGIARRMQHNRGMELGAAAQELRERGYVLLAPPPAARVAVPAPKSTVPETTCPVPGCGEASAPWQRTAEEFRDLCKLHRTRARDLICKLPEYTPATARARVITGERPAGMRPATTHAERGARGGNARTKTLRPAVAETVRRVPAAPPTPAPAPLLAALAPAGAALGERVAIVRRLVACEARAGGVEAVEQLVELSVRCGGHGELVALVAAVLGGGA